MVIRQIKEKEWEAVYEKILKRGKAIPLSKQYDLTLTCNGTPFILRVQLETKRRILVLQALEVCGYMGNAESDRGRKPKSNRGTETFWARKYRNKPPQTP